METKTMTVVDAGKALLEALPEEMRPLFGKYVTGVLLTGMDLGHATGMGEASRRLFAAYPAHAGMMPKAMYDLAVTFRDREEELNKKGDERPKGEV